MRLSNGAKKIYLLLKIAGYRFELEYEFKDLKGNKSVPLRYDFAILNSLGQPRALIEFDGEAHFNQVKFFQHTQSDFKRAQGRDRKKNKYALLHGIPLYRIPYWEIDNIKSVGDIFQSRFFVTNKYHNDLLKAP